MDQINRSLISKETLLGWSPLLFCLLVVAVYPMNPDFYIYTLLFEDGIIEWLTVLFTVSAAWIVLSHVLKFKQFKLDPYDKVLLILYALGCIFFAGEEISWGQRIFDVDTEAISPTLAEVNKQDELNIHNITGFTNVRLIADLFCVFWGIVIPIVYAKRTFPISILRRYVSPRWLIPGFATCILITWPKKIVEFLFSEENSEWVVDLALGELKEGVFGLMIFLFALHIETMVKNHYSIG